MKYASLLYDTSVYITYRKQIAVLPKVGWHSSVVLAELMMGANDRAEMKSHRTTAAEYEQLGRLLNPTPQDWLMAGQILQHHLSDLSRAHPTRQRPKLSHAEKQSLIRDALIAVTAKQHIVTVISDNKDFPMIQRYYPFKYRAAADFFAA